MRGEDTKHTLNSFHIIGSPPHARGRPLYPYVMESKMRITPACAGKTITPEDIIELGKDHPRMRGEDSSEFSAGLVTPGSPPHARGRHAVKWT